MVQFLKIGQSCRSKIRTVRDEKEFERKGGGKALSFTTGKRDGVIRN